MKRYAIKNLIKWKESQNRKPLIIRGARQVGKTWLMKEFGKTQYKKTIYINFENNELMCELFSKDMNTNRILEGLELEYSKINADNTLIILDEIQECPKALTTLKYFYENNPQYHIIAAGSLLGVALHENISFPVGKVDFLDLYPLSFLEFLEAIGEENFVKLLEKPTSDNIKIFKPKYIEWLKKYYYIGGMPEVVNDFVQNNDYQKAKKLWKTSSYELLLTTKSNFQKYEDKRLKTEVNVYKQVEPYLIDMDFDAMIKKIEDKHLLSLEHSIYPKLKSLKKLRNRVHLQECSDNYDHDYNNFNVDDYEYMKKILYKILTCSEFCNNDEIYNFLKNL